MDINPQEIDAGNRYKLLIGSVVPRPIAFVSTISPDGHHNIAPFSFFVPIGANPMLLAFCPANNLDGSPKDTLVNASPAPIGVGQFVVNIAAAPYQHQMAATAEALPPDESEFDFASLSPSESKLVRPPRLAESPVCFECETTEVKLFTDGEPGGSNMVIGRVVHIHIADDALLNERFHVDSNRLAAIGRMGGRDYCTTADLFELPVGRAALESR
jgi:flavin reductase (DIM6/NTAB) family NADH-FMN oxidoreductase RutF